MLTNIFINFLDAYIVGSYLKINIFVHIMNQLQTILISVTLSVALTTYMFFGQSLSNIISWDKIQESSPEKEQEQEQEKEEKQDISSENEIIESNRILQKSFEVMA